jgi:hypothetical protein
VNKLQSYEGKTFKPIEVKVTCDDGSMEQSFTFIADIKETQRKPPDAYWNVIKSGLSSHGYEEEIIRSIETKLASLPRY